MLAVRHDRLAGVIMKCSCGKLISRHMQGKCFACRYEEMKVAKIKAPVKCKFCGKEFIPRDGRKYCSTDCSDEQYKIAGRIKGQTLITKTCQICGEEFQVKRSSTRELCLDCKHMAKSGYKEKPKVGNIARAEKMRKIKAIKASGMTYGQYMANRGIKPEEPAAYRGTLTETQSWMQGPKTIEVHPDAPPPKARIKRKV